MSNAQQEITKMKIMCARHVHIHVNVVIIALTNAPLVILLDLYLGLCPRRDNVSLHAQLAPILTSALGSVNSVLAIVKHVIRKMYVKPVKQGFITTLHQHRQLCIH